MAVEKLSPCIGTYESNSVECVGADGVGACWWKNRCSAFTKYLKVSGKAISDYLDPGAEVVNGIEQFYAIPKQGSDAFSKFCIKLLKESKKAKKAEKRKKKTPKLKKRKKSVDKRRKGPTARAKKAARNALAKRSLNRKSKLSGMLELFKLDLLQHLGKHYKFSKPNSVIMPGHLHAIDRAESSGYVSIYYMRKDGKNIAVISLRYKTSTMTFDACLPLGVDVLESTLSKTTFEKLSPIPILDGRFKSMVVQTDKERLSVLAETIAILAKKDKLKMPSIYEV